MENLLNKHILFGVLQTIRILSILILLLPIPLTFRLLIIYCLDYIDCTQFYQIFKCESFEYQFNDKLIDILIYIIIFIYFTFNIHSSGLYILFAFILYRIIGVSRFIMTQDRTFIIRYPDIVREFSIVLALIHDKWLSDNNYTIIISAILVAIYKSIYEYIHHIYYESKKNI